MFRHVISIGSFCGTAIALQRFDLRDASYPFDWLICRVEDVVRLYDTDFVGFLDNSDELYWSDHPEGPVLESHSNISFWHDFDKSRSIPEQLPEVRAKYERRIRRLLDAGGPVLFVRHIVDGSEFDYLEAHMDEVMAVLRKRDERNDLMLIANRVFVPQVVDSGTSAKCGGRDVIIIDVPASDAVNFVNYDQPHFHRALRKVKYPALVRLKTRLRRSNGLTHSLKNTLRPVVVAALGERRVRSILSSVRSK